MGCLHVAYWLWWAVSVSWPWLLAKATGRSISYWFKQFAPGFVAAIVLYICVAIALCLLPFPLLKLVSRRIRPKGEVNGIDIR